jgi:hypothetical protein
VILPGVNASANLHSGRDAGEVRCHRLCAGLPLALRTDNRYDGATALNVLASVHTTLGEQALYRETGFCAGTVRRAQSRLHA